MTPIQIQLVQDSFEKIRPKADIAADVFYQRLFELAPELRSLFGHDMKAQGAMFMAMIYLTLRELGQPHLFIPRIRALGNRHFGYGVTPVQRALVAEALLWMLEHRLAAEFTASTREAWIEARKLVGNTMRGSFLPAMAVRTGI